ncbi:hypothetical protein H6F42_10190 [Pseudanabaena sp. FACHB-1998]|uniref:hypothetical protein n=1 Tax=Pseudanabaena sp. FACHB-1998 TaxID=2692858 RepID=UPI001680E131|nr:hypothetical protein [Pseudanabaena sp. FACHB-1998]MBD2177280.1 hypothetical protein [Pseudanabaena sp. FACHB-1998]
MTTDNQTIENSDALKDLDIYCQATEQTALESIVNAWHNFEAGKEFLSYCKNKLPNDKRDTALKVSRYSLSDLPEVEHAETLEFTQAALNLKKDEFDVLVMSLSNGLADWQAHEKRAKNDPESLETAKYSDLADLRHERDSDLTSLRDARNSGLSSLQKSQSSNIASAKQQLESCSYSIERKKSEIKDLNKSLLIETLFLIAALIFGASVGGVWGVFIAFSGVYYWRINL